VSIEIANESGVEVDETSLAGLARHVLDNMRVHPLAELSVLLVDEPAMTELHVRWMGEPGPTDVLAFPMDELRPPQPGGTHSEHATGEPPGAPGLLGDVVICPQVAAVQAEQARHGVADEISLLCTHGILHLLGYDHAEPDEHATMFGLQDRLLASWRAGQDPAGDDAGASASPGDGPARGGRGAGEASGPDPGGPGAAGATEPGRARRPGSPAGSSPGGPEGTG
jgi:probable rRNA maturation factor